MSSEGTFLKEVAMPWQEVKPMSQKLLFVTDYLRRIKPFSELCLRYGISRKTGYKWVARYQNLGFDGLLDQSRRPKGHPLQTPYAVHRAIIELRTGRRDPPGAKKLRVLLQQKNPDWPLPSETTIYNILVKEGLICTQRRRKCTAPGQQPFTTGHHPNDIWSADFKGQFNTKDGPWCYPLTIMDHQTRYLLACQNQSGTLFKQTQSVFEAPFRKYGLPWRILTGNGVPFASQSPGGLSRLSKWWIRLGIAHERIEPGKPQQNGRHERMHRTLKKASVVPPAQTPELQQQAFDLFRDQYNNERPHEGLGH
jgi:transposase InsO family protein